MKDKKHPIDDFFRKGLEDHKTEPSPAVWEKIAAETGTTSESKGGWYMMRAAVVVLLVGLSTWVYFENNDPGYLPEHGKEVKNESATEPKSPANSAGDAKDSSPEEKKKQPAVKKEIPIMQKKSSRQSIYVANEPLPEVVEDEFLATDDAMEMPVEQLNPDQVEEITKPAVKVKIKLTKPITASTFYASNEGEEEVTEQSELGFRERIYAYANDQFGNLLNGRPLELPKTEKRPQLEINLDKLLDN